MHSFFLVKTELFINIKIKFKNVSKIFQKTLHCVFFYVKITMLICVEVVDGYA